MCLLLLFPREPPQVATGVRAASKLVQPRAAKGAVRSIPPNEVRDRAGCGQQHAEREQR